MEKKLSADQIRELEQENIRREMARKKLGLLSDNDKNLIEKPRGLPREKISEISHVPSFAGLNIPQSLKLYDSLFIIDLPLYIKEQFKGLENNLNTSTAYSWHLKTLQDIHEILTNT